MDLSTVRGKLTCYRYATLADFVADVERIFANSRCYNAKVPR